jgi:hypothetical protein
MTHLTTPQRETLLAIRDFAPARMRDGWVPLTSNGHWCNEGCLRAHPRTVAVLERKSFIETKDDASLARVTAAGLAWLEGLGRDVLDLRAGRQ